MMNDLIWREDAIKAFKGYGKGFWGTDVILERLGNIPAVELKANYISIDEVMTAYNDNLETSEVGTALNDEAFVKSLRALSPVVERKHGEWIDINANYTYIRACSNCGWQHDILHYGEEFCPHCGCRMFDKDTKECE